MPRLPVVLVLAAVAVVLGAVTAWFLRPKPDDPSRRPVAPVASGSRPAIHVFGSAAERAAAARRALADLTAGEANRLGSYKDDLALLAGEPAIVVSILDHFHRRSILTKYEAAGFADIFRLVKHPEFVEPTSRLLDHEEWIVRRNAIDAARTQAHPSLSGKLLREYRRLLKETPNEGELTRREIIEAASVCGGDEALDLVVLGLRDPATNVRFASAAMAAGLGVPSMVRELAPLLDDADGKVAVRAAWSMHVLGDAGQADRLVRALDPRATDLALMAIDAVVERGIKEALPVLRGYATDAPGDLRESYRIALALLGDPQTLEASRKILAEAESGTEGLATAIASLVAAGDTASRPKIRSLIAKRDLGAAIGAIRGIAAADGPPDRELLAACFAVPGVVQRAAEPLDVALRRAGDAMVPELAQALERSESEDEVVNLLASLKIIGTEAARAAVVSAHAKWPAFAEGALRLIDLERRRRGLLRP